MYNVLLADDEEKILWLLRKLIAWEELDLKMVAAVSNGEEAYEKILNEDIDIVITDIKMPGMDGLQMIEQARQKKPDISFIVISGYNQFEYAQRALRFGVKDFILKPIKKAELNHTLQSICDAKKKEGQFQYTFRNLSAADDRYRKNRKEFLGCLLQRTYQMPLQQEIEEKFQLSFVSGIFICASVWVNVLLGYADGTITTDFAIQRVENIIQEEMSANAGELETYIHGHTCYILLNIEDSQSVREYGFRNLLKKVQIYLEAFDCFSAGMYVGEDAVFTELPQAMQKASRAAAEQIMLGTGEIITDARIAELSVKFPEIPLFHDINKKKLSAAAECCDEDAAREILQDVFCKIESWKAVPAQEFYVQVEVVVAYVYDLIYDHIGKHKEISQQYHLIETYKENAADVHEFLQAVQNVLFKMLEQYFEVRNYTKSKPVNQAKEYIEQHLEDNITLNDVAASVDISPHYFSQIFKQVTDENFVDYVIRRKMERAKIRLKTTDDTIERIAETVGYKDKKFFSRQFEKIVGLKPSKYRKLYR